MVMALWPVLLPVASAGNIRVFVYGLYGISSKKPGFGVTYAQLAKASMRLATMGVDPETKQACLILMSSFAGKLGHWAQHNIEVL